MSRHHHLQRIGGKESLHANPQINVFGYEFTVSARLNGTDECER
jgi:hypothetical protein